MWKAAPLVAILIAICFSGRACPVCPIIGDPGTGVILENRTSVSVKVDIRKVKLDYTGVPDVEPYAKNGNPVVPPGETLEMSTLIYPGREIGSKYKYFVTVITESDTILWQQVFTWDELDAMDWTIIIESQ